MANISQSFNAPIILAFFHFCPLKENTVPRYHSDKRGGKEPSQCTSQSPLEGCSSLREALQEGWRWTCVQREMQALWCPACASQCGAYFFIGTAGQSVLPNLSPLATPRLSNLDFSLQVHFLDMVKPPFPRITLALLAKCHRPYFYC